MQRATLIETPSGFQIEFRGTVTAEPTWDLKAIALLLYALGIRHLDLRIDDRLDEVEQLLGFADVMQALRQHRESLRLITTPDQGKLI